MVKGLCAMDPLLLPHRRTINFFDARQDARAQARRNARRSDPRLIFFARSINLVERF